MIATNLMKLMPDVEVRDVTTAERRETEKVGGKKVVWLE
jgi:hypothetical protein